MRVHIISFLTRDGGTQLLSAANGCARCWLHWDDDGALWWCILSDKTNIFFVDVEEVTNFEIHLRVRAGISRLLIVAVIIANKVFKLRSLSAVLTPLVLTTDVSMHASFRVTTMTSTVGGVMVARLFESLLNGAMSSYLSFSVLVNPVSLSLQRAPAGSV